MQCQETHFSNYMFECEICCQQLLCLRHGFSALSLVVCDTNTVLAFVTHTEHAPCKSNTWHVVRSFELRQKLWAKQSAPSLMPENREKCIVCGTSNLFTPTAACVPFLADSDAWYEPSAKCEMGTAPTGVLLPPPFWPEQDAPERASDPAKRVARKNKPSALDVLPRIHWNAKCEHVR